MSLLNNKMRLGAVSLEVTSLEKTVPFYRDVLGLSLIRSSESFAELGVNGTVLVKLYEDESRSMSHSSLFHMAFLLPSDQDLTAFLFHVSGLGVEVGAGDHAFSVAFYLDDPEGNGIEVYWDRPKKDWPFLEDKSLKAVTDAVDVDRLVANYNGEPWMGMPIGTTMGHVHLQVVDVEEAKNFYIDFLGMDLKTRVPRALFVSKNDYHHHLGLNAWNRKTSRDGGSLINFEMIVTNLNAIKEAVRNQSVYLYEESDNGFFLKDGSGVTVSFVGDKV